MKTAVIPKPPLTRSQRYWLDHIQQQQSSGLSMASYAKQRDLSIKTFYAMRQKLGRLSQPVSAPLFQAVTLTPEPVTTPGATLVFHFPGQIACEVRQADAVWCARMLQRRSDIDPMATF
jgi:hypothetical protein